MSHVICRREPTSPPAGGFSLLEALAALAIVGMALVIAANGFSAYAATVQRTEARQRLLWAAENAIESVRGGQIQLATGPVNLDHDLGPPDGTEVHLSIDVRPRDLPGLFVVEVRAWSRFSARREELELTTMVWRP